MKLLGLLGLLLLPLLAVANGSSRGDGAPLIQPPEPLPATPVVENAAAHRAAHHHSPERAAVGAPVQQDMEFAHLPPELTVRTDALWVDAVPQGWNLATRRGEVVVASDPLSPTGGSLQLRFPAGLPDGHEAGVAYWGSGEVALHEEMFVGVVMRYSEGWRPHANQVKLHLWNLGDANGNQVAWFGVFDGCRGGVPGHWTMAVWGRDPIAYPQKVGDCWVNNIRPSFPRHTPGTWVKHELYARRSSPGRSDGVVRMWVDGQLVLDATNLRYPTGFRWSEFQHAGTWGGGGPAVPQAQTIHVARTVIATR
jgi:hypothetical protein